MNDSKIVNWPGWPLENNPYGEDFDLPARKRMLAGSQILMPFIQKYKKDLGNIILEVGPFFNPLITPKKFPKAKIFYWENDYNVLKYLKDSYRCKNVYPIYCDLNKIEGNSFLKLKLETKIFFKELKLHKISFDSVVLSHVFNYIDYKLFLMVLKDYIKKDGFLFINNVVDYGLPAFFSEKRPKSIPNTIRIVKETGYNILEQKIFESPDKKNQKHERLIIIAKSNEK
jgi:hypothetical protein